MIFKSSPLKKQFDIQHIKRDQSDELICCNCGRTVGVVMQLLVIWPRLPTRSAPAKYPLEIVCSWSALLLIGNNHTENISTNHALCNIFCKSWFPFIQFLRWIQLFFRAKGFVAALWNWKPAFDESLWVLEYQFPFIKVICLLLSSQDIFPIE